MSSRTPAQRYLAEFLGTFALVFAGCGAVISQCSLSAGIGNLGIAVTFGAVVGTMVCALGPISAAHFNPAVTLAFSAVGR
ncbi:MAG: aquaporin, partial [Armatimonadetes bacterium]|nr:aquaporin [Armatimonadota bacterium]